MKRRWISFLRILHTGVVNFIRNLPLAIAAMAVMIVTLTIVLFSLIANATFANTINQITSKIDISIYLKDSTSLAQTKQLEAELQRLPNTESVEYLSKAQVLALYQRQNAGNQQLQAAITQTANPLPATIHVKPRDLNRIGEIKTFLSKPDITALQSDPPSYSGNLKQAIDNITHATNVLRRIGIITVAIFAVVSVLIIFNTIQMAIFNRRDEIQIMRLLGASTNYIRGPFIVESAIYGFMAGVISFWIVYLFLVAGSSKLSATSFGILDVSYAVTYFSKHFFEFLGIQLAVGILIGTASSVIATRRYLRFKVR